MDYMIRFGKWFINMIFFIFHLTWFEIRKLIFAAKFIEPEYRVLDFMEVFKPTRIFFLFNILALLIFLLLPQGQDVLLIVIEDIAEGKFGALASLLFGLTGWSVVAEFGARYKLYIADNSAYDISAERVEYRKQLQIFFSMVYLILPFLIILLSLVILILSNIKVWQVQTLWPYLVCLLTMTFLLKVISQFYLESKTRLAFRKRFGRIVPFLILPPSESKWTRKLFGIYNDFVLRIRYPGSYQSHDFDTDLVKKTYEQFIGYTLRSPVYSADKPTGFPDHYMTPGELPQTPDHAEYPQRRDNEYTLDFSNPKHFTRKKNPLGAYRWIYKIKPSFYRQLHRQVLAIAVSSVSVLLLITSRFNILSEHMGAPALVCLSFGCWQGIYVGLLYLDSCALRKFPISLRYGLFAWMLFSSYFNLDHPARRICCANNTTRPDLVNHFDQWQTNHLALLRSRQTDTAAIRHANIDTASADSTYPVIFVTAEGGALRTGAFTAMVLAALQDSFPGFRDDIYSFSTISGGTVGVSFFNAISYLDPDTLTHHLNGYYTNLTSQFFACDQLSPVLSKMFYGDPLSSLSLSPIETFDRAIALEKAWEKDYEQIFDHTYDMNIYSMDFMARYPAAKSYPAWFINTTEVETGFQCYISNVKPTGFIFNRDRDLLAQKMGGTIRYSTAVNFSSRFPLVSPSAALRQDDTRTFHYVDGGYVENTGSKTMLELLTLLRTKKKLTHIKPYVIQLRFGPVGKFTGTGFLNEISSILYGIYNTRNGSSSTYSEMLRNFTEDSLQGKFITIALPATSKEVPMDWVLSDRSLTNLKKYVTAQMRDSFNTDHASNELHKLYWFDSAYMKKYYPLFTTPITKLSTLQ